MNEKPETPEEETEQLDAVSASEDMIEVQTVRVLWDDDSFDDVEVPVFMMEKLQREADESGKSFDEVFSAAIMSALPPLPEAETSEEGTAEEA